MADNAADNDIDLTIQLCNVDTDNFIESLLGRIAPCDELGRARVMATVLISMAAFTSTIVGAAAAANVFLIIAADLQKLAPKKSPPDSSTH